MTKRALKKTGMLEVVFILDRSGSMGGKEEDTIGGFNSMLEKQQETSDNIIWTTVLFDNRYEVIHDRVPVQKVSPLTEEEYYVRGSTALLDAVGRTIHRIARHHAYAKAGEAPEKTLFVITTDGRENASCEYSLHEVRQMIEEQQDAFGWEFIFLGSNIDAVREGGRIGIRTNRCVDFLDDSEGMQKSYEALESAMCSMSIMEDIDDSCFDAVREDYRRRGSDSRCRSRKKLADYLDSNDDDYGLTLENPIEVKGIDAEYFYLNNLGFEDGSPIFYERNGSWSGPRERPIDKFKIYRTEEDKAVGNESAAVLYIYGYGEECSLIEPRGFKFRSDEYVRAVTRPDLFIPDLF